MRMVDLIHKKRDGGTLTTEEIQYFITSYTNGEIPDYQVSAMLMAIYFRGMDTRETSDLTMAIVHSGEQIDLSAIHGRIVDKHSTGGVGDTTSIILVPLVAACGVPVAKMSGRGLGHTGGTIDKLESFANFSVEIDNERFVELVNKNKLSLVGQSGNLTPADKLLYALRDVTATVESIPLIAASIMSKKIAAGTDSIVLDVKVGSGAFMKNIEAAKALATTMVNIGAHVGRQTVAVISDMNQPLGRAVGNALEIKEAIDTLQGKGPRDLEELCLALGSHMLVLAGKTDDEREARAMLQAAIRDGSALEKLVTLVESQGGDPRQVRQPELLPTAPHQFDVCAPRAGYVHHIASEEVGITAMLLGAGRATKQDDIDLSVGIVLNKKVGDYVEADESIATLHVRDEAHEKLGERLLAAYSLVDAKQEEAPLVHAVVRAEG